MTAKAPPQAFISSYAPRLRTYANSLLTPVTQPVTALAVASSRTTKRGTTAINYAEDGYEDFDEEDEEGRRRPTGLRSLRREDPSQSKIELGDKFGKEAFAPVEVQGIWRDWMGKSRSSKADLQMYSQAALPLTLIPIRIDVDIPAFIPAPPLPLPTGAAYNSIDPGLPVYRLQDMTVPYRLKDIFLWNLHETLTTTDQFAQCMVQDLDLPNKAQIAMEISKQIRTQLEEYAGVALHPLFHSPQPSVVNGVAGRTIKGERDVSATPIRSGAATPMLNGAFLTNGTSTPMRALTNGASSEITASAASILPESDDYNPDDTYRCIITLNINLSNYLYTDKFEWSLLHPPGTAEIFAKQTCADMGLAGEWVPAMTHAIYEAVLRLKKEACESGGLVGGNGYGGEMANEAANGAEAGWRYDPEHLADEWEPKVELLSKEEIEKREGDRERQIRRLRRETARFSSTTNMLGGIPQTIGLFDQEPSEERMGRGERSKKKRRFRSLSPVGRSGTPGGRGTPDTGNGLAGYGGGGGLNDYERNTWRCGHCKVWGSAVWTVRDGPGGGRVCICLHLSIRGSAYANRTSHYATTAASSMSVTANCQLGRETYTRWILKQRTIGSPDDRDLVVVFISHCLV
jgi:chromatin structure-remodeling complex subunit SFH1